MSNGTGLGIVRWDASAANASAPDGFTVVERTVGMGVKCDGTFNSTGFVGRRQRDMPDQPPHASAAVPIGRGAIVGIRAILASSADAGRAQCAIPGSARPAGTGIPRSASLELVGEVTSPGQAPRWHSDLNAGAHMPTEQTANCSTALVQTCPGLNHPMAHPAGTCMNCLVNHSTALLAAGCTQTSAVDWCAGTADTPFVFLCVWRSKDNATDEVTELRAFVTPSDADPDGDCPARFEKVAGSGPSWETVSGNLNSGSTNIGSMYLCMLRRGAGGHGPGIQTLQGVVAGNSSTKRSPVSKHCPSGSSPVLRTPLPAPFDFDPKGIGLLLCTKPERAPDLLPPPLHTKAGLPLRAIKNDDSEASLGVQKKRWLTSAFKSNEPAAVSAGIVNTVFDYRPRQLVAAHAQHSVAAFMDLGFTASGPGMKIWNLECDHIQPPASCGQRPVGCGFNVSGLLPGWEQILAAQIAAIGPALSNHSIAGVFLGDELCGTANIPVQNFTAVATMAKALMVPHGGGLVYANEAVRAVNTSSWGPQPGGKAASPCYMASIPAAVDLISMDFYAVPIKSIRPQGATGNITDEATLMRQLYAEMLTPKLSAHQNLLVVPGSFADGNTARSGSLASQDALIAAKLRGYFKWMEEDSRIQGLNAYHWLNDGKRMANGTWLPADSAWLGLGLVSLPLTQAVMITIAGTRVVDSPRTLMRQKTAVTDFHSAATAVLLPNATAARGDATGSLDPTVMNDVMKKNASASLKSDDSIKGGNPTGQKKVLNFVSSCQPLQRQSQHKIQHKTDDHQKTEKHQPAAVKSARRHGLHARLPVQAAPPAQILINPLKGLAPLQKVHHSWPFGQHGMQPEASYRDGVFHDYARITGALPYSIVDLELASLNATVLICEAVRQSRVAAGFSAPVVSVNFSPWYEKFKGNNASDVGPQEKAELTYYNTLLSNLSREMNTLNTTITVGAFLLDSEKFAATPANHLAVIRKHDLIYNLTKRYFPAARIELYGRGTMVRADSWPAYCATHQGCKVPADPWWMRTSYTLQERGESLAISVYTVPEIWEMRAIMIHTVALARQHNASGQLRGGVTPWISLGAGYRRIANHTHTHTHMGTYIYQYWDFDKVYSWQLGAELNRPWWGSPDRAAMTAPWGVAQVVCLFPSVFDPGSSQAGPNNRSTVMMQHFVNYVRGANGLNGLVLKSDDNLPKRRTDRATASCTDPTDCTNDLQRAIIAAHHPVGSGALLVPLLPGGKPWIVRPILLNVSDIMITFAPGVEILAMRDQFHGKHDCLFSASLVRNVTLLGYGATWRMHKADYQNKSAGAAKPYSKAEWRHGLQLHDTQDVVVAGLTITQTGGDGIDMGGVITGNVNTHIKDCQLVDNHRQGMSIGSAKNLLVECTLFANTSGTAPQVCRFVLCAASCIGAWLLLFEFVAQARLKLAGRRGSGTRWTVGKPRQYFLRGLRVQVQRWEPVLAVAGKFGQQL